MNGPVTLVDHFHGAKLGHVVFGADNDFYVLEHVFQESAHVAGRKVLVHFVHVADTPGILAGPQVQGQPANVPLVLLQHFGHARRTRMKCFQSAPKGGNCNDTITT